MTSTEIQKMQDSAAKEAGNALGKDDTLYCSIIHGIYLLEIAYQLAIKNERNTGDRSPQRRAEGEGCLTPAE